MFVPFNHPVAERITLSVQHGVIGVDFNLDHLAVTETGLDGNMLRTVWLPLLCEDATSGQREALLSDALSKAVSLARESRCGRRSGEKGAGLTEFRKAPARFRACFMPNTDKSLPQNAIWLECACCRSGRDCPPRPEVV